MLKGRGGNATHCAVASRRRYRLQYVRLCDLQGLLPFELKPIHAELHELNSASSTLSLSRRSALTWTLLLIIPNLALLAWLFRDVSPGKVFADVYVIPSGQPTVCGLPAAFLVLGLSAAFLRNRRPQLFRSCIHFAASPFGFAIVGGVATMLVAAFLGEGFLSNMLQAAWGAAVLFCATGIGLQILTLKLLGLHADCCESPLERFVLAAALGLGALSLAVFAAASAGIMNTWFWRFFVIGFSIWNILPTRALAIELFKCVEKRAIETSPLIVIAAVFGGLFLLAHAPLVWNLPVEYDVLEYHLAAPAQYLRAGSASFLTENIYATFPQIGEMLFLLPMMLAGDKLGGLPGAHVLIFAAWGLTLLGVYALARRLERSMPGADDRASSPGPIAAALLYAAVPMGSQLAADFYVEHIQALFHTAALLCACAFVTDFKIQQLFKGHARHNPAGWLMCAGLFAGFCCGTKYTGLIFTLLPLAVFLCGYCALTAGLFEALIIFGKLVLPAALAFAPWMLRNGIASGDPLHPLGLVLRRRLSGAGGIPDRIDHFEAAVRSGEVSWRAFCRALKQLLPGFRESYLDDVEMGPQLCFFAVPGLSAVTTAETYLVAFAFVADLLIWLFFSHRLNRFFYPHLTALAALGGLGFTQIWQIKPLRKVAVTLCCLAVLLFTPIQMHWIVECSSLAGVAGRASIVDVAKAQVPDVPILALAGTLPQASLPDASRVLFVGEAQTFYCTRTPSYSVVFNPSLLEEALRNTHTTAETLAYLHARGITHIYFNFLEWLRLDTSYALQLDEPRKRWELVRWKETEKLSLLYETMRVLLIRDKKFAEYAATWPDTAHPAYLKLTAAEYERLTDLYQHHSHRIWPDRDAALELRQLE